MKDTRSSPPTQGDVLGPLHAPGARSVHAKENGTQKIPTHSSDYHSSSPYIGSIALGRMPRNLVNVSDL